MEGTVARHTLCIRHFFDDLQQHRRQFQIRVIQPGRGNLSRPELKEELAKNFSVSDTQTILISSFHKTVSFSKGFGMIYDSVQDTLQHEPKHRLAQNSLKAHVGRSTKASTSRAEKNCGIKSILAKTH